MVFQPLLLMRGYADMNACTVWLYNSCSRMIKPGCLGPVSQVVICCCTFWLVVPPLGMLQSSVLCGVAKVRKLGEIINKDQAKRG